MTFDALTLHALHPELERDILGGRVDSVHLIDERSVALEVYSGRRSTLVFNLRPDQGRIYLTRERVPRGTERVTPLLLLLRKYVRGSRITAIHQPELERVLTLRCASHQDSGVRETELVAEIMGRRCNLVLVDEDGTILDALVRLPPSVNPARPLLPHLRYTPPHRDSKLHPLDPALGSALAEPGGPEGKAAWQRLVSRLDGISPLAAREAVARAGQDAAVAADAIESWETVATAVRSLVEPVLGGTVEPTIARRGDEILGYAPYALRQFPDAEMEHPASMSDVIAAVARHVPSRTPHDALRRPLFDALSDRLQALRRKRGNLERSLASADHADELRTAGEAILALAHDIAEGQTSISWEGQRIDLYPTLSPVENAQAYFRRYRSARDASRTVPPLLGEVEAELDYLEEMAVHVRLAQDQADLSAIRRELQERSILPAARGAKVLPERRKPANAPTGPYRRFSLGDAQLLVGASARGNEVVTFRLAQPDDLWFHAHGLPGSHVVLRTGTAAHDRDVRRAAEVAAWHSSGKADGQVQVDYTHKKHVRRLPGAPGRVTYRNEKTVLVSPAPPPH